MSTSLPSLSVVIPHYGSPTPALALCEQLADQDYDGPLQIIVADDASPEPFPSVPGVDVVRRARNGGFGAAVNTGAAVASGEYLLIVNSDVTVPATFLADLMAEAQRLHPALVAPAVVQDGVVEVTGRDFPRVRHQLIAEFTPLQRFHRHRLWQRAVGLRASGEDAPLQVDWVAGVAMLLPRSAFEDVGGFDQRFHMYAEEVDLQVRLRAGGVDTYVVPGLRIQHAGGVSSDPARTRRWLTESRLRYADKWGGGVRLRGGLLAVRGLNLGYAAARKLAGRPVDLAPLRDDVRAILDAPLRYRPFRAE